MYRRFFGSDQRKVGSGGSERVRRVREGQEGQEGQTGSERVGEGQRGSERIREDYIFFRISGSLVDL